MGNLSVGGSGKSSLVRYMGELLKGLHVCILSRGYGRKTKGTILVSERGKLLVDWDEAGDEPYMLAKLLPRKHQKIERKDKETHYLWMLTKCSAFCLLGISLKPQGTF